MVVIVEGGRGTGKTTLCEAIHGLTGWCVYRPFRKRGSHTPGAHDPRLEALKINTNSYIEDIYAADVFAAIRPVGVILDRSLPSALAYNARLDGWKAEMLADIWSERMAEAGKAILLHLELPSEMVQQRLELDMRSADVNLDWERERIAGAIQLCKIQSVKLDSSQHPDRVLASAMGAIGVCCGVY